MGQFQSEPHNKNSTPYERPLNKRASQPSDRRDSALHSLSRSITRVFSKVVGKPREIERVGDNSTSENSSADVSTASQTAAAPAEPIRNVSTARKASIDFSLLKTQNNLRIPAHLIIEAYREALRTRSEASTQQNANGQTEQNLTKQDQKCTRDSTEPKFTPPKSKGVPISAQAIPLDRLNPKMMGLPSPKVTRQSKISFKSRGISKPRPKALKHRIQIITKPLVDLSELSDARKHRPGFISANFEVSDDESDHEFVPQASSVIKVKPEENTLKRRPLMESSKLKQFDTATTEIEQRDNGFSLGNSLEKLNSETKIQAEPAEKPAFSFTSPSTKPAEVSSTKLVISVGEALKEPKQDKHASANMFSFGPPAGSGGQPKKKQFSFIFSDGAASAKEDLSKSDPPKPELPKFNFSAPSQNRLSCGSAQPQQSLEPAKPNLFSFGTSENEKPKVAAQPAYNFGSSAPVPSSADMSDAPKFDFQKRVEALEPAEASKFMKVLESGKASKPAETPESVEVSEPVEATKPAEAPKPVEVPKPIEAPKFAFGGFQQDTAPSKETPPSTSFTFGGAAVKPAFQFGTPNPPAEAAKPAFSFGSFVSKENTPAAATSVDPTTSASKTPFIFGAGAANPETKITGVVNFGTADRSTANNEAAASNTNTNAPATTAPTFGSESKKAGTPVSFTFGASSNTNTAQFTFGSSKPSEKSETQPFAFGNSAKQPPNTQPFGAASKLSTPQPFTFRNNTSTFGASIPKPAPAANPDAAPFNQAPASNTGFAGFGQAAPPSAQAPSTFGGAPVSGGFNFGSNNSVPTFGMPAQSGANQPDSRDTTPIPVRKIAQVKKRLHRR